MADRYCRICMHEKQGLWFAYIVASPEHDRVRAFELHVGTAKQFHDAGGCAGDQCLVSKNERSHVSRMKAVDVFPRIDSLENGVLLYVFWKRELNQNAIDGVVFVQLLNFGEQLFRTDAARNRQLPAVYSKLLAGFCLHVYIGRRRRVFPDQYNRESGVNSARLQVTDFSR